jgi:hypothetical protein
VVKKLDNKNILELKRKTIRGIGLKTDEWN